MYLLQSVVSIREEGIKVIMKNARILAILSLGVKNVVLIKYCQMHMHTLSNGPGTTMHNIKPEYLHSSVCRSSQLVAYLLIFIMARLSWLTHTVQQVGTINNNT